jgi:hypothetical protein
MIWPFLAGRMILRFGYRRRKMEKISRRIRTVYTIANTVENRAQTDGKLVTCTY